MSKIFSLTFFLFMAGMLHAQQRCDERMAAVASEQLQQPASNINIVKQTAAYSAYVSSQGGFVVVSRNTDVPKVLGYTSSTVDMDNLPDGLQWWLDAMESIDGHISSPLKEYPTEEVPNFMSSQWGQGTPYNMLCPVESGKRSLTGCVATALGQALYLYRYPSKPVGTNSFLVHNAGPYRDEFAYEYKWSSMMDYYTPNVADNGARPVAELLRDCGYATGMNYSSNGSEALCYKQAVALTDNFSYSTANIRYAMRSYYSNDEWMHIIYRELAARRPVLYTGLEVQEYNADGTKKYREGHSFLFTGMDAEGRLYVNWGWNGMADGYFDFSDMAPTGIQNYVGTYHFNYDQEMVYGVTLDASPSPMTPKYSDFGTLKPLYTIEMAGNTVLYLDVDFINRYYLPFYGAIHLVFDRNDGQRFNSVLFDNSSIVSIEPALGFSLMGPVRLNGLQEGTYRVYVASKATNDTQFQPLRCEGGPIYYELTKSASGSITLSEARPMDYHDYTSGISAPVMSSDCQSQRIYTIGGQQAPSIRHSNIYIMNGKKVVVK